MTQDEPKTIADLSNAVLSINVAGKDIDLRPLRPADFADVQRWLVSQRTKMFQRDTPTMDPVTRADALAKIVCTTPPLEEVLISFAGRLRLVWHATGKRKNGVCGSQIKFETMIDGWDEHSISETTSLVMQISGMVSKKKDEDPLPEGTPTDGVPQTPDSAPA